MSILQEARQLCKGLQEYYRAKENGYHPECEPLIVSESARMLPELLAYAERREAQAIELKAKIDYPNYDDLPEEDHDEKRCIGDKGDFHVLHYRGKRTLRVEVAKELSASLPPRITEEEKAAIGSILNKYEQFGKDFWFDEEELKVLRGMIK